LILIEIDRQPLAASTVAADRNAVANVALQAADTTRDEIVPLATVLNAIRTSQEARGTVVTLSGNGRLEAGNLEEALDAPRLYVDFPKVSSLAPGVTEVRQGPIERIRVTVTGRSPFGTRVVVELNRKTTYWVQPPEEDSKDFRIVFQNQLEANTDAAIFAAQTGGPRQPSSPDAITALTLRPVPNVGPPGSNVMAVVPSTSGQAIVRPVTPTAPTETPKSPASVMANVIGPSGPVAVALTQTPAAAQPPAPPAPPALPQGPIIPPVGQPGSSLAGQGRVYTGQPVVLDFQGADLRAVLRTFAEISGLNMVIDPSVQGTVDVALRDVPWDQALDIILRTHNLGYSIDGTIVRIAPLKVLADEEAQRRTLAEQQALSGELRVFTRSLSYAKAEDIAPLLVRTALTQRGTVQVDARTNTLIITDLPNALQTVTDLIGTLDKAQPQVEIEARIVQTSRNFARTLGVQWGFNGRVAQDLGNTTGLAFPNQGSLTGRTGGVQGPIQGEIIDHAATVVNLGVGAPPAQLDWRWAR
jgi:type IV pilus assembly protein PilQ